MTFCSAAGHCFNGRHSSWQRWSSTTVLTMHIAEWLTNMLFVLIMNVRMVF